MKNDWFLVEANLYSYNGKHWLMNRKRYMMYRDVVFVWNPRRELWEYAE